MYVKKKKDAFVMSLPADLNAAIGAKIRHCRLFIHGSKWTAGQNGEHSKIVQIW